MKKILSVIMASLTLVTLVACGAEKPEEVVNSFYKSLKEYNIEEIKTAVEESNSEEKASNKTTEEEVNAVKNACKSVDAKVVDTKIDGDNATVDVEVTAIDGNDIMKNYMQYSLTTALNGAVSGETDEELEKKSNEELLKLANNKDAKKSTQNFTIRLVKKDNVWKIQDWENVILETFNLKDFADFAKVFQGK
ncbi:hypothetical protein [Clostridium sp.]|uniref:hypothetical protein n=1 Tax=Clostridium sp. TaxID=1506 RepID=UPI002FCAD784